MSLLLDALKKAEKDKLKAREAEAMAEQDAVAESERSEASDESAVVQQPDVSYEAEIAAEEVDDGLELTLHEDDAEQEELEPEQHEQELEVAEPQLAPPLELEKNTATTSTVSDEALQLLIYKTNKKYGRRQKLIWGSLVSMTIIILLLAGTYYYLGMVEEVEALERKHKLAMRVVTAEPVKRRQSPAVVELPLVEETVAQSVQNKAEASQEVVAKAVSTAAPLLNKVPQKNDFTIKKTKIEDPISALLRKAWLAYNRADYVAAASAYQSVLNREPRNRDALLGVAALAVKDADYEKAKAGYRLLLKLDPRDQVAVAAMTNLEELSSGSTEESKLKFMLQQQPSATHLNYALGNYYARKSQWPEAQSAYFKAWQGNSENADYVYNLAVSLDQLGKTEQALRFYKKSLIVGDGKNVGFLKSDVEQRIEIILGK